jgi:hypothetical protein
MDRLYSPEGQSRKTPEPPFLWGTALGVVGAGHGQTAVVVDFG